ncbi:RtcB family protein [Patescibacteria group bacterium]|nr:RtcB family protein [Patescibacteria group bacterium]MBU1921621.1 RtcB family protein [Patescibacteria group bacterium]
MIDLKNIKKLTDFLFEIPKDFRADMRVPARVYATDKMLGQIADDRSLEQLVNVAALPGICKYSLAMPDMHEGYGFPIGGVAAMDADTGVVSPGGVGYDINCGVRLLRSALFFEDIKDLLRSVAHQINRDVPSGVGRGGDLEFAPQELDLILNKGARRMLALGYATKRDLEYIEEGGCSRWADAAKVSDRAKRRGHDQIGTLGSGNHFLEIQKVEEIYEPNIAAKLGLKKDQIVVMIHTGSRGLGHQVCADYVKKMIPKLSEWGIELNDKELAAAPLNSPEGKDYLKAMAAAANFAWANRQMITHLIRGAWDRILGSEGLDTGLELVYDVAHNMAKIEEHEVDGKKIKLCVHRKGATRAFGPGRAELNALHQETGQPVFIPGTMGTSSYLLVGTDEAMAATFGTVCHGAGRRMSRKAAKRKATGAEVRKNLEQMGIVVECASSHGLAEEAPDAYKDVDEVVEVVAHAGLGQKVIKLKPLAVIKGG